MPVDPAGNFSLVPSYFAQPGTTIRTEQHNPVLEDIAQAISQRLMRDGRNGMVGNLDMGAFAIRNVAPGNNATDAATVSQVMPVGSVVDFAGATAPSGWMLCYGQAISRTTYASLFAVIGTTFGVGDGSTTFNLPDLRGRVTAGKDNMGGTAASRVTVTYSGITGTTLGSAGGLESHTLTVPQMPTHNHGGATTVEGAHAHVYTIQGGSTFAGGGASGVWTGAQNAVTSTNGSHAHSIINEGGGLPHNNTQPTIIMNKIIKVTL